MLISTMSSQVDGRGVQISQWLKHPLLMYFSTRQGSRKRAWWWSTCSKSPVPCSSLHFHDPPFLSFSACFDTPIFLVWALMKTGAICSSGTHSKVVSFTFAFIIDHGVQVHVVWAKGGLCYDIHPCTNGLWDLLRLQSTHNSQVARLVSL